MNDLFLDKRGVDWFIAEVESGETYKCPCGYIADYGVSNLAPDVITKKGRVLKVGLLGKNIFELRCPICEKLVNKI